MPSPHPRPWHRDSVFGDGPRVPMCRERRAVWKARMDLHRRAKRITDGESYVGRALIKRLGKDGRCDPSHQTLADDSGESVSTVQRAVKAFYECGMLSWVRRLVRQGSRVAQTSNAYLLTLGRCDFQSARATCSLDKSRELLPYAVNRAKPELAKDSPGPSEGSDEWARWNRDRLIALLRG